ncbi:uncharacterized protein LOC110900988 [Helianthus annuus]|uniref:uncharacterized protein LOC110900988 n=1 Tax=Helianthus annuus TaxID=4232 RepID=UPI000B907156|nr:uncharacterized protein LOC110900988 [Helianthus annuus]
MKSLMCAKAVLDGSDGRLNVATLNPKPLTMVRFVLKCWVNLRVLYLVSFRLKVDIPVYHGWIIAPQDIETSNAIGSKSYDTLMEDLTDLQIRNMRTLSMNTRDPENHESDEVVKETDTSGGECSGSRIRRDGDWVTFGESTSNEASSSAVNIVRGSAIEMTEIISGSSTSTSNENEDEVGITARQGELIKNFLDNNASQLTVHGLYCLIDGIKDRELCVLFRNDHFSTMFKVGSFNKLCMSFQSLTLLYVV